MIARLSIVRGVDNDTERGDTGKAWPVGVRVTCGTHQTQKANTQHPTHLHHPTST